MTFQRKSKRILGADPTGAAAGLFSTESNGQGLSPQTSSNRSIPVEQASLIPAALTVSELTRQIKNTLEGNFSDVWVQGEISNVKRASSGHVYFTLKDEQAQLAAILWKSSAARLKFDLKDGLEVLAAGTLEVYEARGNYNLVCRQLTPQGMGPLELAYRQLFDKLEAEGLFRPDRKRPLPTFPRRVALITSPTGAAVRDLLQVLGRRWPATDVVVIPVPVQGDEAPPRIAAALRMVHRIPKVDVVITGRGGGSIEDLWAFNTEVVARAIVACRIPVVSAVGHEVDVTIADHVADRRALTPSEAAELVVPDRAGVQAHVMRLASRLTSGLRNRALMARAQLERLSGRRVLAHPLERVHEFSQRVDELEARLVRSIDRNLERGRSLLAQQAASLNALSPLNVLERGYSVTRQTDTGIVVRDAMAIPVGSQIESLVASGRLVSRVEQVFGEPQREPVAR